VLAAYIIRSPRSTPAQSTHRADIRAVYLVAFVVDRRRWVGATIGDWRRASALGAPKIVARFGRIGAAQILCGFDGPTSIHGPIMHSLRRKVAPIKVEN
jgi:hypothetical protein